MDNDILKAKTRNRLQSFIEQTKIYKYIIVNNANNYSIQITNKYTKDILLININFNKKIIALTLENENNDNFIKLEFSLDNKGISLYKICLENILKTF